MCLVISVLLAALGVNFYLNGFYIQSGLMAVLSLGFIAFMLRNFRCKQKSCGYTRAESKEDLSKVPDSVKDSHV